MKRLLITGATGGLGAVCRRRLTHMADVIRLSARRPIEGIEAHEEFVLGELSDKAAVEEMVKGCDGILHLGGQAREAPWDVIRTANIDGLFNLYEAVRKHGKPRILFASSNHTIGFYRQTETLDASALPRPDGLYGISKVFGEALASMYHDKFGIETACVRIGSCFPQPKNHRMLATWLSYDDFVSLIECVFRVPVLGCPTIYGMSRNDTVFWDNSQVAYLGWQPKDNAESHRARLDAEHGLPDPASPDAIYHGGAFVADGIFEPE